MRGTQPWRWTNLRGFSRNLPPAALPPDIAELASDVELVAGTLGQRRPASTALALTSGPTAIIHYLSVHRLSTTTSPEIFAFSGSPMVIHKLVAGASPWASVTISDTASGEGDPHAVTFNDKFYIAYNSSVNRLHLWDGTTLRRVGLGLPAAPTVADTGSGSYAATARRYRIQFLIKSGADVIAMSELSSAVSFTPSGAGTAARITKSATVDSATHWRIYGLLGTVGDVYDLYEQVGSDTVVATTTLDDSADPATYSGAQPPDLGLNIPPPSAKFLLTDGNRVLMAGAWETTAGSGETVPKMSRVWITRVLGSSDQGDDESIPNTATVKGFIDVGERDGDHVVGLGGPVDGVIYVFKTRAIYQLVPTGNVATPYEVFLVSRNVGAYGIDPVPQRTIVSTDREVYFNSANGVQRISPSRGLEHVGRDIIATGWNNTPPRMAAAVYDAIRRSVFYLSAETGVPALWMFSPDFAAHQQHGLWQGGWVEWHPAGYTNQTRALAMFPLLGGTGEREHPLFSWFLSSVPHLDFVNAFTGNTDSTGATVNPILRSRPLHVAAGASRFWAGSPILEAQTESAATPTVKYFIDYGREVRAVTLPALTGTGGGYVAVLVEGLEASDAQALQVEVNVDSDQQAPLVAVVVPHSGAEPL